MTATNTKIKPGVEGQTYKTSGGAAAWVNAETGEITGTVTGGAVVWNGSAWTNQLLTISNFDSTVSNIFSSGAATRAQYEKYVGLAAWAETIPWHSATANNAYTSGSLYMCVLPVTPGQVLTNMSIFCGTAPTWGSNNDGHWYIALYDTARTKLVQTADGGHAMNAANVNTLALASTYTVPAGVTAIYAGVMVYIGTGGSPATGTLRGASIIAAQMATGIGGRVYFATADTNLTSATAPSPAASLTGAANPFHIVAS